MRDHCAGHKVEGKSPYIPHLHFMSAHEKNAGDLEIGHEFIAVNDSLGWLNNVSGSILSVPTIKSPKSEYILTTMNEELLAAIVPS